MEAVRRLRRKEAAAYLERTWGMTVAPASLAKYVTVGGGPRYQKLGKFAVYEPVDLDQWATDRLSPKASNSTEMKALEAARAPA